MKTPPLFNTHLHIRQIREELNWSQKFVADAVGLNYPNYNLMEQGKQQVKLPVVVKFWNLIYEHGVDIPLELLITGSKRRKRDIYRTITKIGPRS